MNLRRPWRWVAGLLLGMLVVAGAALLGHLRQSNLLYLQICMTSDPPPLSWLCGRFFYRYHPTPEEVRELNGAAGARLAFEAKDEAQARRQLRHYLDAGVDINAVDLRTGILDRPTPSRFTALHGAVLGPDVMEVRLLLEFGASTQVRDSKSRTPLDLARELQGKSPSPKRAEVIRMLEAAAHAP